MDDMTLFEARFEDRLRAFARTGVQSVDSAAVARSVSVGHPRSIPMQLAVRGLRGERQQPWQRAGVRPTPRSIVRAALGAAAAVALVVSGAMLLTLRHQPFIGGPSLTPIVGPSQSAVVAGPSASPSPTPTLSPTPTPILWTEASREADWPAPVRIELVGDALLLAIDVKVMTGGCPRACEQSITYAQYTDPTGDSGADVAWLDITEVEIGPYRVMFNLASNQTPDVDPTERWYAYGIVFDDDRDGVPDRRFGLDNVRTWMTDLHTGRTLLSDGASIGGEYLDTTSPRGLRGTARFSFGGDTPTGPQGMELDNRPFYVWASLIQDGRVVATDYAPDVGWLDTSVQTTEIP